MSAWHRERWRREGGRPRRRRRRHSRRWRRSAHLRMQEERDRLAHTTQRECKLTRSIVRALTGSPAPHLAVFGFTLHSGSTRALQQQTKPIQLSSSLTAPSMTSVELGSSEGSVSGQPSGSCDVQPHPGRRQKRPHCSTMTGSSGSSGSAFTPSLRGVRVLIERVAVWLAGRVLLWSDISSSRYVCEQGKTVTM